MRYSFTTLACVALAATSLAAPVIDKRARDIKIITEYTTIVTTQTITETDAEPTAAIQAESYNYNTRKNHHSNRISSSVQTPVPTSTVQPITIVTSIPVVETPITTIETTPVTTIETTPLTTEAPVVTSTPEPETIITTIEPETTAVAPATTTTSAAATATVDSFAAAILDAHNSKRALHGAPALVYDATMAAYAQGTSDKCIFEHSGGPYGENLASGYATPADAIEAWYDEQSYYDYAAGEFTEKTGHFTQVVWKSATKVGCGLTTCNSATAPGAMLTCNYDTGNVIGYFVQNVLPLTS